MLMGALAGELQAVEDDQHGDGPSTLPGWSPLDGAPLLLVPPSPPSLAYLYPCQNSPLRSRVFPAVHNPRGPVRTALRARYFLPDHQVE